jgi:hypothetical protein
LLLADNQDVDVNGFLKYKKIKISSLDNIVITNAEDILLADLLTAIATNDLVIGRFYRITDSSVGEPIIVQGVALNMLSEIGISGDDGKVYKYNVNTDTISSFPSLNDFVPYSGATNDVDLGEFGVDVGFVTYDTTPTNTPTSQATTYWDSTEETLALIMNGVTQRVGLDTFFNAKNSTGTSIPKGTAVRFAGTDGNSGNLLIAPMLADGTYPSVYYMGITAEAIGNGQFGKVMSLGKLRTNTNAYVDGDILYVSSTVAGGFQTTAPLAPNNIIIAASVVNAANNGVLEVRATLGSNINNDEGVKITTPLTGQLLQLQSNGLWENKTLPIHDAVTLGTANGLSLAGQVLSLGLSSSSANGALSSTDWSTFNAKQAALNGTGFVKISGTTISYDNSTYLTGNQTITLSGEASGSGATSISVTLDNAAVINKVLTGLSVSGSAIVSTDSILVALGKAQNQINALAGGVSYQGTWNASTNTPSLTSSVGTKGYYYVVSVAGSTNLNGITDWKLGDWVIFNGSTWDKVDNTDAVISVNGYTGIVTLAKGDIGLGNVENTALSTWAGSTNITTLGTIGTGVWQGTAIGDTYIASSGNWNTAFNNSIVSASFNTSNGVVTLTQQDAGTVTVDIDGRYVNLAGDTMTGALLINASGTTITSTGSSDSLAINHSGSGDALVINNSGSGYAIDVISGVSRVQSLVVSSIANATTDTDRFLVSDSGTIKYRTGAELLSDIGGATAGSISGTTGKLAKFTASGTIGDSIVSESSIGVGIGVTPSNWDSSWLGLNTKNIEIGEQGTFISAGNSAIMIGNNYVSSAGSDKYARNFPATFYIQNTSLGSHEWYNAPTGTAGGSITFTKRFEIKNNGQIITANATDTGEHFIVGGSARINNSLTIASGAPNVQFIDTTNGVAHYVEGNDTSLVLYSDFGNTQSGSVIDFRVDGNTTRMSLSATELITFGATDTGEAHIFGGSARVNGAATIVGNINLSDANNYIYFNQAASTNGSGLIFKTGSTFDWYLGSNPTGLNNNDFNIYSYGTSDIALKIVKSTGAATFSSSVSAGTFVYSPRLVYDVPSDDLLIDHLADAGIVTISSGSTAGLKSSITVNGGSVGSGNANTIKLNTAGVDRLTITSGGNVGIGTTSPSRLLHINGAGTDGTQVQINGTTDSAGIKFIPNTGDVWEIQANISSQFFVYNRTDNQYRFLIDSTGNVGIGTTTPGSLLDVNGEVRINNTVAAAVAVASTHKVTMVIGGVTYYLLATT